MNICPKCGGVIRFKWSNLLKWSWWSAKVHPIPGHFAETWMAPRWYSYIFMPIIYLIMLGCILWICVDSYKVSHPQHIEVQVEAPSK